MRTALKEGTMIRIPGGAFYQVAGEPIGEGGAGIIYPVYKYLPGQQETYEMSPILYALKECYPVSSKYAFCRNETGEIRPEKESEAAAEYLAHIKQMQLLENAVTGDVYHKGFRLTPVLEAFSEIEISQDGGASFQKVRNGIAIMESIAKKGVSLKNCLKEKKHLPADQTFRIIEQVLYAVREVHDAGYLHLDIQDGNIFLKGTFQDASGMISLIDFGSAGKLKEDGKCAAVKGGVFYTTPGFSAPEISFGDEKELRLGMEADLYSIGYLMLLLLTGRRFSAKELEANKTGRYIPRFSIRKTRCPKHLTDRMQSILAKALKKNPQERYANTREMLADITEFLALLAPYKSPMSALDYDAFICYKHGDTDTYAARELRNALERYQGSRLLGPKPIKRVFLDEGELSSCSDFGERIREALKNSAWLIVICSLDTKTSPWVNDEIETFLEYHDTSHILTVVTQGEPGEVFPDALLRRGMDEKNLFAADSRAADRKKLRKKIRGSVKLKIAAPILHTTFDTLKQRRKLYEMKKAFAAFGIGMLILSAFLGYVAFKSKQIADQAVKIAQEHKAALKEEALRLLEQAKRNYEENDPIAAVKDALQAYDLMDDEGLTLPGLIQILGEAMGVYTLPTAVEEAVTAKGIFEFGQKGLQKEYFLDSEGKYLFTSDTDNLYIWDTETFACVKTIPASWSINIFGEDLLLDRQNRYLFVLQNEISCYDYEKDVSVWNYRFEENIADVALSDDKNRIVIATDQKLYLFDSADGTLLQTSEFPDAEGFSLHNSKLTISADYKRIAFVRCKQEEDSLYLFEMILYEADSDTYSVLKSFKNNYSAYFTGLTLYFTDQNQLFMENSAGTDTVITENAQHYYKYYSEKKTLHASLYDLTEQCIVWEIERNYMASSDYDTVFNIRYEGNPALALVYGCNYEILDPASGEILDSYEMNAPVISAWNEEDKDVFVLENGNLVYYKMGENRLVGYAWFPERIVNCQKAGSNYYIREKEDFSHSKEDYVVKYQICAYSEDYEPCLFMEADGDDIKSELKNAYPEDLKKPEKNMEYDMEDERRHIYMLDNTVVIEEKASGVKQVLEEEEHLRGFCWMKNTDKLLIGYETYISLYDLEKEAAVDAFMLDERFIGSGRDFGEDTWQIIDDSTVINVEGYYSFVMDISEDSLDILYVLTDYYAYDEENDDFYFLSGKLSMDKINDGIFYDKQELGRIKRYGKEEMIEMARRRYR